MKFFRQRKMNLQIFADTPAGTGSGGGTAPTPTPAGTGEGTTPTAPSVEVPEYITNYVSGFEDAGQKEYLQSMLADEKGVNFLKGIVPNPDAEWKINAGDYKDIGFDAEVYISDSREKGISEATAKSFLDARKNYLTAQREMMTPELRAMDTIIENFISSSTDVEKQGVYRELANNAAGRKVLKDIIEKQTSKTPSAGAGGVSTGVKTYTHKEFEAAYNAIKPYGKEATDKQALRELEDYARNSEDRFFRDFLGLR